MHQTTSRYFSKRILITVAYVLIIHGTLVSGGEIQNARAPDYSTNLVILNKIPDLDFALRLIQVMTKQAPSATRELFKKNNISFETRLSQVKQVGSEFFIDGVKTHVTLTDAKTLEFNIGGIVWKFNPDARLDWELEKLSRLLKATVTHHKGFSLFPNALAQSPNNTAKDLTYLLGAITILAIVVVAIAAAPVSIPIAIGATGAGIIAGTSVAIGGVAGGIATVAGAGTLASALYWGGSSLLERIKYGKASLFCKDRTLYAKIDGMEIKVDRHTTFNKHLNRDEAQAIDAFYEKYNCNPSTVSLVFSQLKSIFTGTFSGPEAGGTFFPDGSR